MSKDRGTEAMSEDILRAIGAGALRARDINAWVWGEQLANKGTKRRREQVRAVDRELQKLRLQGLIVYSAASGWRQSCRQR